MNVFVEAKNLTSAKTSLAAYNKGLHPQDVFLTERLQEDHEEIQKNKEEK